MALPDHHPDVIVAPVCPVCGTAVLDAIETDSPPYSVFVCRDCDTGFVAPPPPTELLTAAYDADYYAPWASERAARDAVWERRFERVAHVARGPLLDVGCGDGGFLRCALAHGLVAEGTEFSADAVRDVHERVGVPVHHGELTDLELAAGRFQTITLWHVLEHTRDPVATLREAFRLLAPGGALVVAVPNRNNVLFQAAYRIARRRRLKLFDPEDRELHLFHFTPASLQRCVEISGFDNVEVSQDRAHINPGKRAVEKIEGVVSMLTGAQWWGAQMAVARKP